jgi:hypothetical protein
MGKGSRPRTVDTTEYEAFGIKPNAIQANHRLTKAMQDLSDNGESWNCNNNPYFYVDYDGYGFEDDEGRSYKMPLTDDQAEELCFGCPLIKLCYDFAVAQEVNFGIWGGINFGVDEEALF